VKTGEPGVFIGKITAGDPIRAFLGYVDKTASEKKIVQDVFKHGDTAFLSGAWNYFLQQRDFVI
jgi:solute carrier family 27 (fatty acid transporter), member 1/4